MNITISPAKYYPGTVVIAPWWEDDDGASIRAIRTDVALDGEVVVTDSGFSWGDTAMQIKIPLRHGWHETLVVWLQSWPQVVVSRSDGLWHAVLRRVKPSGDKLSINLSIIERLDT
jgi:hypothetical protein